MWVFGFTFVGASFAFLLAIFFECVTFVMRAVLFFCLHDFSVGRLGSLVVVIYCVICVALISFGSPLRSYLRHFSLRLIGCLHRTFLLLRC